MELKFKYFIPLIGLIIPTIIITAILHMIEPMGTLTLIGFITLMISTVGTYLMGIKAVLARSFERIHRSNLVGMGVLPLMFKEGDSLESLGLDGSEAFTISGIEDITPRKVLKVKAVRSDSDKINFDVLARLDTKVEVDYFIHGGILPYVLRKLI